MGDAFCGCGRIVIRPTDFLPLFGKEPDFDLRCC
jgi:hypothetical protein